MTDTGRLSALIGGLKLRQIFSHMLSRTWGKWAIGGIAFAALTGPLVGIQQYHIERAAVALVGRADSGGPVLIPARCNIAGTERGRDFVIADGKALRGRATSRACFYTVSAFKRFFPDRYNNDDPSTFRVQQLTTGTRLLMPSTAHAVQMLAVSFVVPVMFLVFAMARAAIELFRSGALHDSA